MHSSVLVWSRARVRARVVALGAAAALAAGIAGCTTSSTASVTVSGKALVIYASAPAGAASDRSVQDVLDAESLAFQQKQAEVTGFSLSFHTITSDKVSNNARTAIEDQNTIAYLGEIPPGLSADSLGINNAQDVLQVSPTDTALELTASTPVVPNAPARYYESLSTYGRTFARVVPNTGLEAKAQVQEMQALGVSKLYVTDDGSAYGRAIAQAVRQDAPPAITVVASESGADAVFDGASSAGAATRTFNAAAQGNPSVKLFGPSALDNSAFVTGLSGAAHNVYISTPGFLPGDLTPAGHTFVSDFTAKYGHAPSVEAIFGYEAMAAVLDVLHEAGSAANNRATVVRDFFGIRNRPSVLGTYSINANGDTSLAPFVFSRLRGGRLVPFKSVQLQG
jgi:branched-chain amino acid transport system substrate-binding protein